MKEAGLEERLGDRIARLRRSMGWNQNVLAARIGGKPTQISKYERGTYEPRLAALCRLAAALGTSTDYLLTGREAARAQPDPLATLWPALEALPLDLRNEIARFLNSVLYAQALLGLSELDRPLRSGGSSPAGKPARRRPRSHG